MKKSVVLLLMLSSCMLSCRRNQEKQEVKEVASPYTVSVDNDSLHTETDVTPMQEQEEQLQQDVKLPYTVSLEREISRITPAGLSEAGSRITYVPFETSDNCLIGNIKYRKGILTFSNSHIALHDYREVFLFDLSGKFIRKIGRKGQGPGEFVSIVLDLCFSLDGNTLFLVDGREIHEYDLDGTFIGTLHYPSTSVIRMNVIDENHYAIYWANNAGMRTSSQNSFTIIDSQNNALNTFKNYHRKTINHTWEIDNRAPLYSFQGNLKFRGMSSDTLQTVTMNELLTYAVFDFGKRRMPILELDIPSFNRAGDELYRLMANWAQQNGLGGKYYLSAVYEDMDNLYFELSDITENLYGYFSKHTGTAKVIGKEGFQNDLDGGLPFFPRYVYKDNVLVDMVDAFKLREHVLNSNAAEMKRKYGKNWDDLFNLANSLEEDANQILVVVGR